MADSSSPREGLQRLQEELLALKAKLGALQLKKAAGGAAGPFPLTLTAPAPLPPAAGRYDVEDIKVRLVLRTLDAVPPSPRDKLAAAVEAQVLSPSLPASLRSAIAKELHAMWLAALPPGELQAGGLKLEVFWEALSRDFVRLISLQPQLLEPYEGVDEAGRTVRRFAILNEEASLQIDAAVPVPAARPSAAAGGGSSSSPRPPPAPALTASSPVAMQHQRWQQEGEAEREPPSDSLPPALAREVAALRALYGSSLRILQARRGEPQPAAAPSGSPASPPGPAGPVAAPAAGAAEAALEQLSLTASPLLELSLVLRPTDPAWDPHFTLHVRCALAASYPGPGSLRVELEPQPPLPALALQVLQRLAAAGVEGAEAAPGRAGALRSAVRYLENHAGQLVRDAEDMSVEIAQRRRAAAAQQGGQGKQGSLGEAQPQGGGQNLEGSRLFDEAHPSRQPAGSSSEASGSSNWSSGSYGSEGDWEGEESQEEEGEGGGSAERAGGLGHQEGGLARGLQLQLEGLSLSDCDSLEILALNLQVGCTRCRRAADLGFATPAVAMPAGGLSPGAPSHLHTAGSGGAPAAVAVAHTAGGLEWSGECGQCRQAWSVQLVPKVVHERSNLLAVVRAEGCAPVDLLPSMLAGQCGRCGAAAAFRSVQAGAPNERNCGRCHSKIAFQFSSAIFVAPPSASGSARPRAAAGPASSALRAAGAAGAGAAAAFTGVLTPGQPLPGLGTCSHYRHSYRWLRFPCCGRRFPCDLCHEEQTDGHEMRWAARMVCGYCSREQPLAERCRDCGKKLATSAAVPSGRDTRFWEGGAGCRDPRRLNRNDARKHRGSRLKTQSRKQSRVGEKGAEQRDARAQRGGHGAG